MVTRKFYTLSKSHITDTPPSTKPSIKDLQMAYIVQDVSVSFLFTSIFVAKQNLFRENIPYKYSTEPEEKLILTFSISLA